MPCSCRGIKIYSESIDNKLSELLGWNIRILYFFSCDYSVFKRIPRLHWNPTDGVFITFGSIVFIRHFLHQVFSFTMVIIEPSTIFSVRESGPSVSFPLNVSLLVCPTLCRIPNCPRFSGPNGQVEAGYPCCLKILALWMQFCCSLHLIPYFYSPPICPYYMVILHIVFIP